MSAKKICICGWNAAAGKCPYPINCKPSPKDLQNIEAVRQAIAAFRAAKGE